MSGPRPPASRPPTRDLFRVRRETAAFARPLDALGEADFDVPSPVSGHPRRFVAARVGLRARLLARRLEVIASGRPAPAPLARAEETLAIEETATLPAAALRNLVRHSAVHLEAAWQDLDESGWNAELPEDGGRTLAVRATPRLRLRELRLAGLELGSGERPGEVVTRRHGAAATRSSLSESAKGDRLPVVTDRFGSIYDARGGAEHGRRGGPLAISSNA
ncbi:MAG: maleylpyruvate isomerase N-terminal domain-containing protein [Geminicoccaceae bacterium]|nr:maleylpyruvate isomerase N-terminal domain-containing protein [Geminicoccaceae bacterium]